MTAPRSEGGGLEYSVGLGLDRLPTLWIRRSRTRKYGPAPFKALRVGEDFSEGKGGKKGRGVVAERLWAHTMLGWLFQALCLYPLHTPAQTALLSPG